MNDLEFSIQELLCIRDRAVLYVDLAVAVEKNHHLETPLANFCICGKRDTMCNELQALLRIEVSYEGEPDAS